MRAVAEGKQRPGVFSVDGPVTNGAVWVLAGFGAQHRKMGKSLYLRNPVFAEWIDHVDALVQDELGYSVLELILDDEQDYGIETTQVTIFAIQIALGELLRHHGAKPARRPQPRREPEDQWHQGAGDHGTRTKRGPGKGPVKGHGTPRRGKRR